MSMLRCFLAVELPPILQNAIAEALAGARRALHSDAIRWVPSRNIHLTLKFLGDTAPSGIELIEGVLSSEAPQYSPFDVLISGFGVFPNSRRPRVLWVGATAPPVLASLQRDLDAATVRLGYASEERTFSPHLTVGRVRQNATGTELQAMRDVLDQVSVGQIGTLRVDSIHLFKSELQPTGSVYSKLFTASLTKV